MSFHDPPNDQTRSRDEWDSLGGTESIPFDRHIDPDLLVPARAFASSASTFARRAWQAICWSA
jgi:hypothetical protein